MRWAFEEYASGEWTLARLTDSLNSRGLRTTPRGRQGVRPLALSNVAFMLSNPYYVGVVLYNGVQYPGRHEPVVDQLLYDKVQDVLASHACGEKQVKYRRYLTSTLYCGYCGEGCVSPVTKATGGTYEYWLCLGRQKHRTPCPQRYLADDVVEAEVVRYWQRVRLPDDTIADLQRGITDYLALIREGGTEKIATLRLHIGKLRAQERELLSLRYEESISRELFSDEQRRIASDVTDAEGEIAKQELAKDDYDQLYAKAADLLRNFPRLYQVAPPNIRRTYNRAIFTHLYLRGATISGATTHKARCGPASRRSPTLRNLG